MTCEGGYAIYSTAKSAFVCTAPKLTNLDTPKTCNPGTTCLSPGDLYSKPCTCGFTEGGNAYCPFFEGDAPLQKAIQYFKKLLADPKTA
jgi:hypothetical protein